MAASASASAAAEDLKSQEVVVVEDTPMVLMLNKKLLGICFRVKGFNNAEEAEEYIAAAAPNSISAVVTDYHLGAGKSGEDLMNAIKERQEPWLKNLPFFFVSGEFDDALKKRCLESGAVKFFIKPLNMSKVEEIRQYLQASPRVL